MKVCIIHNVVKNTVNDMAVRICIIFCRCFGFVARKQGSTADNSCHMFAEVDTEQPATAIVNFVTKVMIGQGNIVKL